MSEPAALDLAAIREWIEKERGIVAGEMGQADWLEALDLEAVELGGTVLDALARLIDELERCRAERDALRAALESVAKRPWEPTDPTSVVAALLTAQTAARAALGEVTP